MPIMKGVTSLNGFQFVLKFIILVVWVSMFLSSTAENLVNHIRENLSWWKGIQLLPYTVVVVMVRPTMMYLIISPIKFNFPFQSKLEIMKKTEWIECRVESIESYYFTIWMSHSHSSTTDRRNRLPSCMKEEMVW